MLRPATENFMEDNGQETAKSQFVAEDPKLFTTLRKEVFTTGDINMVSGLSQQFVQSRVDNGTIKGRTVPGSTHRRVDTDGVHALLKDLGRESNIKPAVELQLLKTTSPFTQASEGKQEVIRCNNTFDLGMHMYETNPHTVVLDHSLLGDETERVKERIIDLCEKYNCNAPNIVIISKSHEKQLRLFTE